MKLKCVKFAYPVNVGSDVNTFFKDTMCEMTLKGNFIEMKAIRPDQKGNRPTSIATIFNVVYLEPADSEGKNSLKNAV